MEHDIHEYLWFFESEEVLKEDEMTGAADRKKFGNSLDQGEKEETRIAQELSSFLITSATVVLTSCRMDSRCSSVSASNRRTRTSCVLLARTSAHP